MEYGTFWQRVNACLIDFVIVVVGVAGLVLSTRDSLLYLFTFTREQDQTMSLTHLLIYGVVVVGLMIDYMYFVFLPARYGATPGKFLFGLRVVMRDGTKVSLNAVMLKHCVSFMLLGASMLCFWNEALISLDANTRVLVNYIIFLSNGWLFLNLFVMACNNKRCTLSDFIADVAVVTKASVKQGYQIVYVDEVLQVVTPPEEAAKADTQTPQETPPGDVDGAAGKEG